MDRLIQIEIVYALPDCQHRELLTVKEGSTMREALLQSRAQQYFSMDEISVGIFGEHKSLEHPLTEGNRLEIYRPIHSDPKLRRILKVEKSNLPRRCR